MNTTDEGYWSEYDGLQHAKHQLLTSYLSAWFPILSSWNGRVVYIDSHAGRGRHATGHPGSPILAIQMLLQHRSLSRILANTKCQFVFFEKNPTNFRALKQEIESLGPLPRGITASPVDEDFEAYLRKLVDQIKQSNQTLAPAFAFIDPYGFRLPMDLLNDLLQFPKCELLINFMYRYVDMAIMGSADNEQNLDQLFGSRNWIHLRALEQKARARTTIDLFSSQLHARYVTHMQMRGSNGALKYVLFHATNNEKGREKFKEAIWSVTPDGSFSAHERRNPNQMILVEPEPDLDPLRQSLEDHFKGKHVRMKELYDWLIESMYLRKHLHQVINEWRKDGHVTCTEYEGRFAFSQNPVIGFL